MRIAQYCAMYRPMLLPIVRLSVRHIAYRIFRQGQHCRSQRWTERSITISYELLWSPYIIWQTIIFSCCGFFLSSIFLFSSPNLSGRTLDVYHTSTHGVALVRVYNAGLKCAARGSLEMHDPKNRQKVAIWAPSHNFVGLYLRN